MRNESLGLLDGLHAAGRNGRGRVGNKFNFFFQSPFNVQSRLHQTNPVNTILIRWVWGAPTPYVEYITTFTTITAF